MALTKSFEKFGSTFADAYHNISDLRYNVHEYERTTLVEQEPDEDGNPVMPVATTTWQKDLIANFTLKTYVDAAARTGHKEAISQSEYMFTPDWESSDNVLAQAYTYLKTLDAFDGAVDA